MYFKMPRLNDFFVITLIILLFSCNKNENEIPIDDTPDVPFTGELDWAKNFGGSNEDDAVSMVVTPDGGYAIAGFTLSTDGDIIDKTTTDADFWVVKLNADGTKLWSKTFGGSNDDRATRIINTNDGGFAVTGFTRSTDGDVSVNNGFYDYWLLKLDASGALQWEKTYGFEGNDQAQSVIQTSDGGFFITGFLDVSASGGQGNDFTRETLHGVGEFWGVKTNALGEIEWRRFFGGTNNDRSYEVVEANDGGFLMIGNSESNDFDITDPKGSYDFWAVKISATGDLLWAKNYGGSEIEIAYAMTKTSDGNYLIVGDTRSSDKDVTNPKGNADVWTIKINDSGTLIWQKTFGGSQFDTARSVSEFTDGNLLITGSSRSEDQDVSANYGMSDFWTIITDSNGNKIFEKNYGGSNLEFGNASVITTNGKIVIAGSAISNDFDVPENKGAKDALLIKLK